MIAQLHFLNVCISIVKRSLIVYWEYLNRCILQQQSSGELNFIKMLVAELVLLALHLFI